MQVSHADLVNAVKLAFPDAHVSWVQNDGGITIYVDDDYGSRHVTVEETVVELIEDEVVNLVDHVLEALYR